MKNNGEMKNIQNYDRWRLNEAERKNVEMNCSGIKCDHCDWRDDSVSVDDYGQWVNRTCPKCGEVVLTEKEYNDVMKMKQAVDIINSMSAETIEELGKKLSPDEIIDAYKKLREMGIRQDSPGGDTFSNRPNSNNNIS